MTSLNKVLVHLQNDVIRNINLINFIKQYPIETFHQVGESVLVRGTSDHTWVYISSMDQREFNELIQHLDDEDQYFAIIEDWMLPELLKDSELVWKLSCMELYFPDEIKIGESHHPITELKLADAEYIFEHSKYKDYTSVAYIRERIEQGVALGIIEDGMLVAWLMTHDDGAMGFLHVLPDYRRRGYGEDLTLEMIKRLRAEGMIPFVHIEEENAQSMGLAMKSGFVKDRMIHWFQRVSSVE